MSETRYWRCGGDGCLNVIRFVDDETLTMLTQGRNVVCPICRKASGHQWEPVAVVPLAEWGEIIQRLEDDALASQTATCERHEGEADPDCVVCSGLHAVVSIYRRRVKGELAARALLSGGA